jgi:hypothetical protein
MRTLPMLTVCGWLVAAAVPALSPVGEVAQAQQLSPPDRSALNLLLDPSLDLFQKELLFRGHEGLVGGLQRSSPSASGPPTDDWLSSLWLSSASDWLIDYWAEEARYWQIWRSLLFSVPREIGPSPSPSPGKGDYWKPGELERLIGPR